MCHGITGDTLKKLVSQLQPSAYRWYQIVGNKELHSHRVSHFHHEWQIRSWCPAKTRLVSHMPIMCHTNTHCRYTYLSLMSYNLYRTICTPHSDSPRHLQVQIFVVNKIALHGKHSFKASQPIAGRLTWTLASRTRCSFLSATLERFHFTLKQKQANRTRTEFLEFWLVLWTLSERAERVHLTSSFDLLGVKDSVHR